MKIRFQDGPQHVVDHFGVLRKDEQQPSQRVEDEAARCRQVLASKGASEAAKLQALNTLNRLRWGS